jgi:hypothetical protein
VLVCGGGRLQEFPDKEFIKSSTKNIRFHDKEYQVPNKGL